MRQTEGLVTSISAVTQGSALILGYLAYDKPRQGLTFPLQGLLGEGRGHHMLSATTPCEGGIFTMNNLVTLGLT